VPLVEGVGVGVTAAVPVPDSEMDR
jgi:hypothetical protein